MQQQKIHHLAKLILLYVHMEAAGYSNLCLLFVEYAAKIAVLWIVKTCFVVDAVSCTGCMGVPGTIDEGVNRYFLAERNVIALHVLSLELWLLTSKTCHSIF